MEIDMPFAWIPPGRFLMGGSATDAEKPQHRVQITKGFWMGVHPVTQKQFESVMGYNPSEFKGENRPVETVSWDDAIEFCKKLSELANRLIRLPTEAEWEYACRAGEGGDYCNGNGEGALNAVGWYSGNSNQQTQPVGQKKPNKWGLYDMHGNAMEWVADWHASYTEAEAIDPKGPAGGSSRVHRGGCYIHAAVHCRSAYRGAYTPGSRYNYLGFRVSAGPSGNE